MNGQAIHASGVNWQSVLTLVTLIGGVLAGCAAFLARTIRGARRFIGHQVIEGTEQIAGQVITDVRLFSPATWPAICSVPSMTWWPMNRLAPLIVRARNAAHPASTPPMSVTRVSTDCQLTPDACIACPFTCGPLPGL